MKASQTRTLDLYGTVPRISPGIECTDALFLLLRLVVVTIPFFGISFLNIGERGILRPDWLAVGLLVLLFALRVAVVRSKVVISRIGAAAIFLNYVVILSAVNLFNGSQEQVIDFLSKYLQLVIATLMFLAISSLRTKLADLANLLRVWIGLAAAIALYGIYQAVVINLGLPVLFLPITNATYLSGGEILTAPLILRYGNYARPSSVFIEPSYFASYLLAPLLLMSILIARGQAEQFLFGRRTNRVLLVILWIGFILAFGGGAYITLLILGLMFGMPYLLRRGLPRRLLLVIPGILIAIPSLGWLGVDFLSAFERLRIMFAPLRGELTSISSYSEGVRLARALTALQVGLNHPVLGVGFGNLAYHASTYDTPAWFTFPATLERNHNMWITQLAETGSVGLFALVYLWFSALRAVRQSQIRLKDASGLALLCAFYYILWSDIINANFTHEMVHLQRWFDLSITALVLNSLKVDQSR